VHAFGDVATGEALDVQAFNRDQGVGIYQRATRLVVKVTADVSDLLMCLTNQARQVAVVLAAPLAARPPLLQDAKPLFLLAIPARVVQMFTSGEGSKVFKPHVDSDSRAIMFSRFGIGNGGLQNCKPGAYPIPLQDNLLDGGAIGQRAVLEHPEQPHILHVQPLTFEADTVPVDIADRFEPVAPFVG
jgi:hypothetical protein